MFRTFRHIIQTVSCPMLMNHWIRRMHARTSRKAARHDNRFLWHSRTARPGASRSRYIIPRAVRRLNLEIKAALCISYVGWQCFFWIIMTDWTLKYLMRAAPADGGGARLFSYGFTLFYFIFAVVLLFFFLLVLRVGVGVGVLTVSTNGKV